MAAPVAAFGATYVRARVQPLLSFTHTLFNWDRGVLTHAEGPEEWKGNDERKIRQENALRRERERELPRLLLSLSFLRILFICFVSLTRALSRRLLCAALSRHANEKASWRENKLRRLSVAFVDLHGVDIGGRVRTAASALHFVSAKSVRSASCNSTISRPSLFLPSTVFCLWPSFSYISSSPTSMRLAGRQTRGQTGNFVKSTSCF